MDLEDEEMKMETTEAKKQDDSILVVPLSIVHVVEQDGMDIEDAVDLPDAKTISAEAAVNARQEGPTFPNGLMIKVSGNLLFIKRSPLGIPWTLEQRDRVSNLIQLTLSLLNRPDGSYAALRNSNYHELLLEHPLMSFTVTPSPLWVYLSSEFEAQPPLVPSTMLFKQLLMGQDIVAAILTSSILDYGGPLKCPLVDIQRHVENVQGAFVHWRRELFSWFLARFNTIRPVDQLKSFFWEENGKAKPLDSIPEPLGSMLAQEMHALMKQYTLRLIHLYEAIILNLLGWPQKLHEKGAMAWPKVTATSAPEYWATVPDILRSLFTLDKATCGNSTHLALFNSLKGEMQRRIGKDAFKGLSLHTLLLRRQEYRIESTRARKNGLLVDYKATKPPRHKKELMLAHMQLYTDPHYAS